MTEKCNRCDAEVDPESFLIGTDGYTFCDRCYDDWIYWWRNKES